jgi:dihydrolipoamide dehydrogenase
VNNIIL